MLVLVMRHGEAVDSRQGPDAHRHLTPSGRRTSREVVEHLAARGVVPTHVYTSPFVRAVQTAEMLAWAIDFPGPIVSHPALVPDGSADALEVLSERAADDVVALVSHEPTVRVLAARLSGEQAFPGFRTSGVALFRVDPDGASRFEGRLDPSTMSWRGADDLDR